MENKLIKIHRVTKVVKGGRIFSYTSTSICGNKFNTVGYGRGKSKEVIESIKKSYVKSNKNIILLRIINKKLPYLLKAKHCSTKIILKPINSSLGIITNKNIKQILIFCGIKNVISKIIGSTNTINVVICTLKSLLLLKT